MAPPSARPKVGHVRVAPCPDSRVGVYTFSGLLSEQVRHQLDEASDGADDPAEQPKQRPSDRNGGEGTEHHSRNVA
jgi:hypothetical protein